MKMHLKALLSAPPRKAPPQTRTRRERGSAMVEFTVVAPVITLIGLGALQYGLLFFAKNQYNHASFMAARAGSMHNASLEKTRQAYARALIPAYGGGTNSEQLAASYAAALADVTANTYIEMLNPTKESFDDWNDKTLQDTIGNGRRVIPNAGLSFKDPAKIGAASGQSIQDANLIKLRIIHGYKPKIPFIASVYSTYLKWLDTGNDPNHSKLVQRGLIPVVSHVTVQMQSSAIEPDGAVSLPGQGNQGNPSDPGDPPSTSNPPPKCQTVSCQSPDTPTQPGDNGGGGNTGGGDDGGVPPCPSA